VGFYYIINTDYSDVKAMTAVIQKIGIVYSIMGMATLAIRVRFAVTTQGSTKTVMPDLIRHPYAAIFAVYSVWIPGQARNDSSLSHTLE
jgi:hypothetical protein